MAITRHRRLRHGATPAALLLYLSAWFSAYAAPPVPGSAKPAPYALIYGTLWSRDERPVYGVRLKLRRSGEKHFRWEAFSDHRGEFAIRVPAARGDYVLVPDLKPAKDTPPPETRIHVENDERVDIGVHLQE